VAASVTDEGGPPRRPPTRLWQESVVLAWWDPQPAWHASTAGREPTPARASTALCGAAIFSCRLVAFSGHEADLPLVESPHNGFRPGIRHMFHDGQSLRFESDQPVFGHGPGRDRRRGHVHRLRQERERPDRVVTTRPTARARPITSTTTFERRGAGAGNGRFSTAPWHEIEGSAGATICACATGRDLAVRFFAGGERHGGQR